ncbi:YesL family protein [Anaerobacillus sp. CMMVII]|uniref:YesL family protein n=1 Tax=Anaerobacillus sp. CMMVII TaxID=2755588 RepID=UPI0021B8003D|nr:YesL family protein [Anaerobacillus sp. CMMVII]MCT8137059.1 YesL family protein [Anaerobacillus sp. CMMVII]
MGTGLTSGFYKITEWFMRLVYVNVLWIIFTLLGGVVFGIMPATVALFTLLRKWLRGDDQIKVCRFFWQTYKSGFIKSNVLGFILIFIGIVLFFDIKFFQQLDGGIFQVLEYLMYGLVILYLVILMYIFPVFTHYDVSYWQYLKHALFIGITKPFKTIVIAFGLIGIYFLLNFMPGLLPFIGVSSFSLILMSGSLSIFLSLEELNKTITTEPETT